MDDETPAKSVLIVDDDSAVRQMVMRSLARTGLKCDSASNGDEALALVGQGSYSVVVTDLRMPHVNGHTLCVELLTMPDPPAVIVITGVMEPRLEADLRARGVEEVLLKPLDMRRLAAGVRNLVQSQREHQRGQRHSAGPTGGPPTPSNNAVESGEASSNVAVLSGSAVSSSAEATSHRDVQSSNQIPFGATVCEANGRSARETAAESTEARAKPSEVRWVPARARSEPTEPRSETSRARSELTRARREPTEACSLATRKTRVSAKWSPARDRTQGRSASTEARSESAETRLRAARKANGATKRSPASASSESASSDSPQHLDAIAARISHAATAAQSRLKEPLRDEFQLDAAKGLTVKEIAEAIRLHPGLDIDLIRLICYRQQMQSSDAPEPGRGRIWLAVTFAIGTTFGWTLHFLSLLAQRLL